MVGVGGNHAASTGLLTALQDSGGAWRGVLGTAPHSGGPSSKSTEHLTVAQAWHAADARGHGVDPSCVIGFSFTLWF